MFGKKTEWYRFIQPLVQELDAKSRATPCEDEAGNREIVLEAMELYQICEKKYLHWYAKSVASSFTLGGGVAAGASTFGISALATLATYGSLHTNINKKLRWQALKNQCKNIGLSAAPFADLEFLRKRASIFSFVRPFLFGVGMVGFDDVYRFLNSSD